MTGSSTGKPLPLLLRPPSPPHLTSSSLPSLQVAMGVPTTTAGGAHLRGAGRCHGDGFPCPPPRSGTMEPPSAPNPSGERGAAPSTARHGRDFFGIFVVVSLPDLIMWKALFLTMIYSSPLPLFCAGCSNGEASSAGHPPPLPCIHLLPPYMVSYNLSF